MKRSEALVYTPAAVAILVAVASIATFESESFAPASLEAPAAVVVPAPTGEVPFIGQITVTATPIAAAADLRSIADAART